MQPDDVLSAARQRLLAYCSLINESYQIPRHLVTVARALEAIERGEQKRLIITIPPRHGKSMLCSQYFPAWYLGRNPDKYLITATYGQELSDDFGRKIKDQMRDPFFKLLFPECELRQDTQAASRMVTGAGGTYFGVGVGGPITGRGAHVLLIDDPVKNREEADSETIRRKIFEWYRSVAYTRLMPGGSVIVIMTRWHEEDLVGMVLKEHAHENWVKIDLKAIADDGKALWPEAYTAQDLLKIRETLGEYEFSCLYQQDPMPAEGILFKAEWLPPGVADEYAAKYMSIDPAISKKDTADETAMSCWGIGYGDPAIYHEIETPHGKWNFEEQINIAVALHQKHKFNLIGVEDVAYQAVLGQELARRGLPVISVKADKDKVRRATSISHYFSQGRCRINTPELRRQLLSFRGQDEKNDLADAAIHCLRLMRDHSSEKFLKKEDAFKGLDGRSRQFWEKFRQTDQRQHDVKGMFGF